MTDIHHNVDSFTRLIAGAVKLAQPDAVVGTLAGFGWITLNGQAFRFTVEELPPITAD